jgi:hypothetical protein
MSRSQRYPCSIWIFVDKLSVILALENESLSFCRESLNHTLPLREETVAYLGQTGVAQIDDCLSDLRSFSDRKQLDSFSHRDPLLNADWTIPIANESQNLSNSSFVVHRWPFIKGEGNRSGIRMLTEIRGRLCQIIQIHIRVK